MDAQPNIKALLFGPNGLQMFCIMMGFLLIGALLRKLYRLSRRKPASHTSPRNLTLRYWLQDNWVDLTFGFVFALVAVRFPALCIEPVMAFIPGNMETNEELLMGCLVIGYGIDKVSEYLATKWNLKA